MKKLALIISTIFIFALMLAFSISASTIYKDGDGNQLFSYVDENADRIIESYEGKFPSFDENGNALTWYIVNTEAIGSDTVHTVDSFFTIDNGTHASLSDSGVYKYVNKEKELSIVSAYFPDDSNVLTLSLSDSGYGNTYDFNTDTSNILFLRLPNTLNELPSRIAQSTPMIECEISDTAPLTSFSNVSFYKAKNLRTINIPSNVTILYSKGHQNDGFTFFQCVSLVEVKFSENSHLETIQQNAFNSCTGLKEITIPNSVTCIEQRAFQNCSSLETLRFSANTGVGMTEYNVQSMMYQCSSLKYVYMPHTIVPTSGSHLFNDGVSSGMVIFYTGDYDQYEALKATLVTLTNNKRFVNASYIEYDSSLDDQYYKDLAASENKNYVVYGYNTCKAFYENEHIGTEVLSYVDYDKDGNRAEGKMLLSQAELCVECSRCKSSTLKDSYAPLFKSLGFSFNDDAIMQGFAVNYDVIDKYESYFGIDISFGLVCAISSNVTDGKVLEATKKICVDYTEKYMDIFEIKLSGISGESYNKTPIYICGYASLGEKTYYISNGSINENATGFEVSYSHIANK